MAKKQKEATAAQQARKARNIAANQARYADNRIAVIFLPARAESRTKIIHGRDGKTREVVVTKAVRPSKLIRSDRRAAERVKAAHLAAKTAARIAAAAAAAHTE